MTSVDNRRWIRFRIAAFYKELLRARRAGEYQEDRDWSYSVYGSGDKAFPDVGIYILYFDEFGPRGVGSPLSVYKIGLSDRMHKRWSALQTGTPIGLRPIHVIETNTLSWTETWLHNALRSRRVNDDQEWFALSADDIKALLTIDVLNKPKNAHDERRLILLFERLNSPDTAQERLFDL